MDITTIPEMKDGPESRGRPSSAGSIGRLASGPEGRLVRAARKFEAMVVEGMVREMWKTIPTSRKESESAGLSLAQELYQKELSKDLVKGGGFGLARQIVEDTRKKEGAVPAPPMPLDRPAGLSVTV